MDIWVSSRTKSEDYTWRTCAGCDGPTPPTSVSDGFDQWKFEDCVPWYGLVSQGDTSILYFGNLKTDREDSRMRPIFVHAALVATGDTERRELQRIVASLLVRESDLLPQWSAYLLCGFDGGDVKPRPFLPQSAATASIAGTLGRFAYPREDNAARELVAASLSTVDLVCPLAVGTTGRSAKGIFERVCNSESRWQAAFFSQMCATKSELEPKEPLSDFPDAPSENPSTRVKLVVGVVAALVICLLILVGPCRKTEPVLSMQNT